MTANSTAPAALVIQHVTTAPDGIVRLFVPAGFDVSKSDLRTAAARIAGTIQVGRTPAGKSATFKGVKGTGYDFAPVVKGTASPAATPEDAGEAADPRVAALVALGLTDEQVAGVLAASGATVREAGKGARSARSQGAKSTLKPAREVPAFLRKWENVTCKTCRDFGKVRGPGAGDKSGKPFRTQHGADSAPTAVPCPSHVTAKGKGRKSA